MMASTATIAATSTHGRLAMAVAQLSVGVTPNSVSLMKSVMSSWAMWIHHSCGSLMKIQMAAAERITVHVPMCLVFQPSRTASTKRKKYSKVFGKMNRMVAVLGHLEDDHADHAVVVEELAHAERALVGPVAQRGEVGDGEVVDVQRLVVGLVAVQRDRGELLEDALVDRVEDQAREQGRHREVRDEQRQDRGGAPTTRMTTIHSVVPTRQSSSGAAGSSRPWSRISSCRRPSNEAASRPGPAAPAPR